MSRVFGIDLGTTYSCIAYIDEYGKPVVLKNSDGDLTTPSVVMVETEGNVIVGSEAKRSLEIDPDRTVQFIKRKMGKEDDTFTLNDREYSAPELSAYILEKLVNDANEELRQQGVIENGEEIKDVVITCPAYFGMQEREATKTAGEIAGLNVIDIINEPTAAAISYGAMGSEKNETVLVYDLGGGTFDITVMNINGNEISVVCTGGDDTLGGKNWDEALIDYLVERYQEEFGDDEDPTDQDEALANLYGQVETWKKALTAREKVNVVVPGESGNRHKEVLTREQYDEITKNLLTRTKNLLDDVLRTAEKSGYPLEKIDKVLLVGGSSRMPQVAKMIAEEYHVIPTLQDPDEAVAKGAAVYGTNEKAFKDFVLSEAQKAGKTVEQLTQESQDSGKTLEEKFAKLSTGKSKTGRLAIRNVLSRSYGVLGFDEAENKDVILNILKCNMKLPAKETQTFWTYEKNQANAQLEIFESRSMNDRDNFEDQKPIAVAKMRFENSVPEDTEVVVTLSFDGSGLLHLTAEEMYGHSKLDTTFSLSAQMTDEEKKEAALRLRGTTVE